MELGSNSKGNFTCGPLHSIKLSNCGARCLCLYAHTLVCVCVYVPREGEREVCTTCAPQHKI